MLLSAELPVKADVPTLTPISSLVVVTIAAPFRTVLTVYKYPAASN